MAWTQVASVRITIGSTDGLDDIGKCSVVSDGVGVTSGWAARSAACAAIGEPTAFQTLLRNELIKGFHFRYEMMYPGDLEKSPFCRVDPFIGVERGFEAKRKNGS